MKPLLNKTKPALVKAVSHRLLPVMGLSEFFLWSLLLMSSGFGLKVCPSPCTDRKSRVTYLISPLALI